MRYLVRNISLNTLKPTSSLGLHHWIFYLSLGCHYKIPKIGWIAQLKFISHSYGVWKSKIRVPAWLGSDEGSPPGLKMPTFSLCSHMAEKKKKRERDWKQLSGLSLLGHKSHHVYAALMTALNLITCPNSYLQKLSLWESGLQHRNLGKEGHNLGHSIMLLQIIQLKIKFPSTQMPLVGSSKAVTLCTLPTANTYHEPPAYQVGRFDC